MTPMPRRSAADKAKTHEKILSHASREFRARGSSVGIADVMKEIGLTQGGFYRHFGSKDELFVDAIALSFRELGDRLERVAESVPYEEAAEAIIDAYLSMDHVRHPETWCALASLAPDIGRMPVSVRKRIDSATMWYMERMSKYMKGADAQEKRHNFILLFSGMAGSVALIRSLGDSGMKEQALMLAKSHYVRVFG